MDETLARLADAAGIEAGYWDGLGTRRDLGEATARALLVALGHDTTHADQALAALLAARWRDCLAPTVCVQAGSTFDIPCNLALDTVPDRLAWRIDREDGSVHVGEGALERDTDAGEHPVAGVAHGRFRLRVVLPQSLPAGYHGLHLPARAARCALLARPARAFLPAALEQGARRWGLAVQVYALRSRRNWGMGDFTDLATLVRLCAAAGADLVGVNPLHARHLARPEEASPYAPSSRLALDPLYLDVERAAGYAESEEARALVATADFQVRLAAARATELVDHAAVAALKLPVLAAAHRTLRSHAGLAASRAALAVFVAAAAPALHAHALFEAIRLWRRERDGAVDGWRHWGDAWQGPGAPATRAFAAAHPERVEFQYYLQWQAEQQLAAVAALGREGGMATGLYRDLAVGASDDGAECWAADGLVAPGTSVGAPPDLLNREGQDWGLPPWNPGVLATRGYAPFAALLAANMRHAGALRIDHVMALTRLFWIPHGLKGDAGGYLRYDLEAMAAVVLIESQRARCLVIGEDLGSVPDGFREALAVRGFLSYRVLLFERHWSGDGSFKRPWEYPAQALATAVTHDMATIADYWDGGDIPRRAALGLFPEEALAAAEAERRAHEREGLRALAAACGVPLTGEQPADIIGALHDVVARTSAMLAVVQLDDVAAEREPINIPGTWREYPNWRRKLSLALEDLADDARWCELVARMHAAGRATA